MAIQIPTFSPAEPHSIVDVGHYIADSASLDEMETLKVKSTLKPNGVSSFVIRVDKSVNALGGPDKTISVYTVVAGHLQDFTPAIKTILLDRVRAVLTEANIARIERGER